MASESPWVGEEMVSFRVSKEVARMLDVASVHEHRNRSELIRRAILLYLEQGGYFNSPGLDSGNTLVRGMVERAKEELSGSRDGN